jgi:hypothetical protein
MKIKFTNQEVGEKEMNKAQFQLLKKHLDKEVFGVKYKQFIQLLVKTEGLIDNTEYRVFQEQVIKRDMLSVIHGYMNGIVGFDEAWELFTTMVGYDLLLQNYIDKRNR